MTLAADVTLADVVAANTLGSPLEYVRGVLDNLHVATRKHGAVFVRLGRMGTGQYPHYRIDSLEHRPRLFTEGVDEIFMALEAYNGRNHKPLVREGEEVDILRDEHWSTRGTAYPDVQALFRQVASAGRRT
jgi:hypothetical protein